MFSGVLLAGALLTGGCGEESGESPPAGGSGGSSRGGAGGTSSGSGGSSAGTGGSVGSGGSTGSGGGSGGSVGAGGSSGAGGGSGGSSGGSSGGAGGSSGAGGAGGRMGSGGRTGSGGSGPADGGTPSEGGSAAPSAPGQGPMALGRIVFNQDFEKDRVGINKGMRAVPDDRIQVVDDPLMGTRGKVLKVIFQQGDNYRTSAGTEPRTWVSNRPNGYEFPPNTKVSHAFGIMTGDNTMNYCFAQVISTGGPVWMLIGDGSNTLTIFCNACGDANTRHFRITPNQWHDFRVDMDFRSGGSVEFFHNGQSIRKSTLSNTRGSLAHWDGGIYNRPAGTGGPTRSVFISNLSIGER